MAAETQNLAGETVAQMVQAFATIPALVSLLEEQARQFSDLKAELCAFRKHTMTDTNSPNGYIEPRILAARKFVTVKEAAFLLNTCEKTVRRLIQRGILTTSKGLRVKRIPIGDIDAYLGKTS